MLHYDVLISKIHCIAETISTHCGMSGDLFITNILSKKYLLTKLLQEKQQFGVRDF